MIYDAFGNTSRFIVLNLCIDVVNVKLNEIRIDVRAQTCGTIVEKWRVQNANKIKKLKIKKRKSNEDHEKEKGKFVYQIKKNYVLYGMLSPLYVVR